MNTKTVRAFRRLALKAVVGRSQKPNRSVVILVPHPDDEVLGCGLLIAALARAGTRVHVVALTDGDASHPGSQCWPPADLARLRRGELRRAVARLGVRNALVRHMRWRDGRLAEDARLLCVAVLCKHLNAGLILATASQDHHPDHKACFDLGAGVARRLALPLVSYAVWSRLSDEPVEPMRNRYKVTKRWALAAHRSQVSNMIEDSPAGFRLSEPELLRFTAEAERYTPETTWRVNWRGNQI